MNIQDLVDAGITRALIIKQPYIGQILDGLKTWVLDNAKRYDTPIPYVHPKGAVIWVNLEKLVGGAQ